MLLKAKLPKSFWSETLYTTAYVINLSPTIALQADVPNRVWYNRDVSFDHSGCFVAGPLCMCLKMKGLSWMSKLDSVSSLVIAKDEFAYKFYDPVEKKLIRSHDAIFIKNHH